MLSTWSTTPSKRPSFLSIKSALKRTCEDLNVRNSPDYFILEGCDQELGSSCSVAEDMTCKSLIINLSTPGSSHLDMNVSALKC